MNTNTVCLVVNDRYFVRFGKGGRVLTAWSLAGAKLFLWGSDDYKQVVEKINDAGKVYRLCEVKAFRV